MLTHAQIWNALDRLAARSGLSASGLAKKAGLDPTTFNKSKRITPDGRARWPSTESVAKSLAATSTSIDIFVQLIDDRIHAPAKTSIPLIGLAQAGKDSYFDAAGFPAGHGWDEIPFPGVSDEHAYALEIAGTSMEPAYRDDTVVIVPPAASIRRGDRVVVKTRDGEVTVKELKRRTAKSIELKSINPDHRSARCRCAMCSGSTVWSGQPVIASCCDPRGEAADAHPCQNSHAARGRLR